MRRLHALPIVLWAALSSAATAAAPLELEWCTGSTPSSWGFGLTPNDACRRVHLRIKSPAVLLTSARPGPGMPEGWTIETRDDREVIATGPSDLAAGQRLETFVIVETNRSTAALDARGALPVDWSLWLADASGADTPSGKMTAAFPPTLHLADAAARGLVLVTCEGVGPTGPVEITVDNPTWQPLWLDVPTGTVLTANGHDWVVASCAPFRMLRKQKTGRTVTAFPLLPTLGSETPRKLAWARPGSTDATATARELAVAADRLQDALRSGARRAGGPFERSSPWDFWPLALKWATWKTTGTPPADLLSVIVGRFIDERATAGDPAARGMDAAAAVAEVEAASVAIAAEAEALRTGPLPLELQAAKERFR